MFPQKDGFRIVTTSSPCDIHFQLNLDYQSGGEMIPRRNGLSKRGLTNVEMLVCISVIGILTAMALPFVQKAREAARRAICQKNISQVILAAHQYEGAQARFPTASTELGVSMFVSMAPYFEKDVPDFGESREPSLILQYLRGLSENRVDVLLCPSSLDEVASEYLDPSYGQQSLGENLSHYLGIAGPTGSAGFAHTNYIYSEVEPRMDGGPMGLEGLFSPSSNGNYVSTRGRRMRDVLDGTSNTLAFGEFSQRDVIGLKAGWSMGSIVSYDLTQRVFSAKSIKFGINEQVSLPGYSDEDSLRLKTTNVTSLGSEHPQGCNAANADGSVHFLSNSIDLNVLKTMSSIATRDYAQLGSFEVGEIGE